MSNKKILLLTDYKGYFSSKQKTPFYRSGMDIPKLTGLFNEKGFEAKASGFADLDMDIVLNEKPAILYTSAEDKYGFYKSFIEDVIFNLEESGILVVPKFAYLKAHNNKVAMELLRNRSGFNPIQTIQSEVFGTLEELENYAADFKYPVVIKIAQGSMSKGVAKADTSDELMKAAKSISQFAHFRNDMKEHLRYVKYKNKYIKESFNRRKFIIQNMIPGLGNDWKVLVYGERCYVLYRGVRDNDFRASGSGKFEFRTELPKGMLDYALAVKNHFNVPNISIDIGFDGKDFHLIEFQFLHFGTTTLEKSDHYFEINNSEWQLKKGKSDLEQVYVDSIVKYLQDNK